MDRIRDQVRKVLQLPINNGKEIQNHPKTSATAFANTTSKSKSSPQQDLISELGADINAAREVEAAINTYLRRASETYDLHKNYEVCIFICMAETITTYCNIQKLFIN